MVYLFEIPGIASTAQPMNHPYFPRMEPSSERQTIVAGRTIIGPLRLGSMPGLKHACRLSGSMDIKQVVQVKFVLTHSAR